MIQLTLQPHQQAQARLSTGVGGLGLPSPEARRMSASIEGKVGIVLRFWQTSLAL